MDNPNVLRTHRTGDWIATLAIALSCCFAFGPGPSEAQVIPDGPQFSVREYPGFFFHRGSDVAVVDLDGNFVVVWATPNMQQILGQRYGNDGSPVGTEFEISTTAYPGNKTEPAVAGDLSGNFVVVWEHERQESPFAGEEEILGRRYDSVGPLDTEEFRVNSDTPFRHQYPSVDRDASSNFVVVWQREAPTGNPDDNDPGIFAQKFDAEGNRIGEEIVVSTRHGNEGINQHPDVGTDLDGDFVVVWQYAGAAENEIDPDGVAGRRFDTFGNPLEEEEFVVNSYTDGLQSRPSVAVDFDGNFIVAWAGEGEGDFSGDGIYAKQFASTGGALGDEFLVNVTTDGFQTLPEISARDVAGHFVVTWQSRPSGSGQVYGVYGRWFRSDAVPFADEFTIPTTTAGDQESPRLAGDVDGNFVVVWNGDGPADEGFFGRRFEQPVLLSINDFSVEEGDSGGSDEAIAVLTVEASRAHPDLDVQVEFLTGDDTANSFDDYVAVNEEIVFPAGATELAASIEVPIQGDDMYEPDETFLANLGNVANAAIVRQPGVVTILNDDDPPGMTIADASQEEGNSGATTLLFRVELTEAQQEDAMVDFSTSDGSATAGSDYEATGGTLAIPGGSTTGFIGVGINGDFLPELDETFAVALSNPENATLINDMAIGTIVDDDCVVAITIDPANANFGTEGGSGSISVMDPAGCGWMATSSEEWMVVTSGDEGVGNGTVEYSVDASTDPLPRNGTITIAGAIFSVTQDGVSCSFELSPLSAQFNSSGGMGTIDVTDPGECGWTATSNDPWITVTMGSGTGDGTVEYLVDAKMDPGSRSSGITISGLLFTVDQEGSFFDHFDDDVLSSSWSYTDAQFWSEGNSFLEVDVLGNGEESQAVATPAFGGCMECTISADMGVDVFGLGVVTLLGWYEDADNFIGLTMDEFANEWRLFQMVGGVEVQSVTNAGTTILPMTLYRTELIFDGGDIVARVDGSTIVVMSPWQGVPPTGTLGFHATETVAVIDSILVITVTEAGGAPAVFADSFESGDTGNWSAAVP